MKMRISPSLLAADFLHLEDEIRRTEQSGADMLHCDVMDGVYVPNISFGFSIIKQIHSISSIPLDVHMMTCCPEKYLDVLNDAGADIVTVHSDYSDVDTVKQTLVRIKELGMRAGVSLKPKCPWTDVLPYADCIDLVLVMTVEPGFGGQKFMADMMPKVTALRDYIDKNNTGWMLEVDGGIAGKTISTAAEAGADTFVAGTAFYKAADAAGECDELRQTAEKAFFMNRSVDLYK